MRVRIYEEFNKVSRLFENYYSNLDIREKEIDDKVFFMVAEKFYFRNSSRASLSICLISKGSYCDAYIVGSGGGQGLIFKFDWGAANSFEREIFAVLNQNDIKFQEHGTTSLEL